ncbi:MAG: dihydropteroate synthase [Chitinophagaceae bacterium]|nr:dihydropteroate synthase [Chitinophagaceae bacterium]MCA6471426.1 dihydropteroate synthase [Chitinophagaceae bacterium]MCA6478847.1 dihydropteroate synthase [Chitinophagaceae bacterium]MCA6480962.1 dihydropteroate synthase [Chitinophagaceae bacterium]
MILQDNRIPFTFSLNLRGRLLTSSTPLVMGIVNVTPDSFYSGSRVQGMDAALQRCADMLEQGADLLDVGGVSTRPGSVPVAEQEEIDRVIPLIEAIVVRFPAAILSVDTFRPEVARKAVAAGASIINDISGGRWYPDMLDTIADLQVPYVLMHSTGDWNDLHSIPPNRKVVEEVYDYFTERMDACRLAGIHDVILDPGIGFGKTIPENFELLKHFSVFTHWGKPLLLAVSRKSMIYKTLGTTPEAALNGTSILHTAGLLQGASIIRVHDPAAAREAIQLTQLLH